MTDRLQIDRDYELVEILQTQAAGVLTEDETRNAIKRIRPEWFGDAA